MNNARTPTADAAFLCSSMHEKRASGPHPLESGSNLGISWQTATTEKPDEKWAKRALWAIA
ncbi:MAG: hypothetical protein WCJ18_04340 [Planctomycetota bacterium]